MARSSFASQRQARTPQLDTAHQPPDSRGPMVLPLHTPVAQCRAALCTALDDLAAAWRALDLRDEHGWAEFAADAARDLAQHLAEHAATVRVAPVGRDGSACSVSTGQGDVSVRATEAHASADDLSDMAMSASAESAADAAALAFLAVVDALAPVEMVPDLVNAAAAVGVIDLTATGVSMLHAVSVDRRAS